jgi:hypothetical protein
VLSFATFLPKMNSLVLVGVGSAILCQICLLVIAGWNNRHLLHPDGVAYLLIASHYAKGELSLAVSGYWGPLLSWLIAPFIIVLENPLYAARVVMGLSAVVFLFGCVTVFRSFQMHPAAIVLSTWIAAMAGVYWSVIETANLSPDLLMSGLICIAISRTVSPEWIQQRRSAQFTAGVWYGAAYLAKAVAFPVAFGLGIGIGALWILSRLTSLKVVITSLGITLLGFFLVALPWIATLSLKYDGLVLSTSAKIAHSIVGPADVDRRHPGGIMFHRPETGRLSSGEDATFLPYQFWSPFSSVQYFKHQLNLIYRNALRIFSFLSGFDLFHIAWILALLGLFVHTPWRENMAADRWRWAAMPVGIISGIYLPVFAGHGRYYYATYPFLLVSSMGMVAWLTQRTRGTTNLPRLAGMMLVVLSFASVLMAHIVDAVGGQQSRPSVVAKRVADKLRALDLHGPIAGVGDCHPRRERGLPVDYVAFLMGLANYGCEENTTLVRIKNSGAELIVADRLLPITAEIETDPAFKNLDHLIFESEAKASSSPWRVYQLIQSRGGGDGMME